MAKKKYTINHSNYTIKEAHQNVSQGSVFERDFMTISEMDGFTPGQLPIYGQSNFKITIASGFNGQKKYNYGSWVDNGGCGEVWSLDCITTENISDETKIELKPNYNSILNFTYYGSAIELLRTSINEIITFFPGELYLTDTHFQIFDENGDLINLGGDDSYIVSNPLAIDLFTESIINVNVDNPLRYMCDSYMKYNVLDNDGNIVYDNITWNTNPQNILCPKNGDVLNIVDLGNNILIKSYYYDNDIILMHNSPLLNTRIRPFANEMDVFYDSLSDFSKILVNRNSVPLYKSELNVTTDTDFGVNIQKEVFIFPTEFGYNIDINTYQYNTYISRLYTMAEYYDENKCNVLWRAYTHEAIKKFDYVDNDIEDYVIGEGVMNALIKTYGRQIDDTKRYADNIKNSNTVTYDNKGNLPNYFLTDALNTGGWEVVTPSPTIDNTMSIENIYSGMSGTYNSVDVDNHFFKTLKLNSKYIFKTKGTRKSLRMLMNMFGLEYGADYDINEFDVISTSGFDTWSNVVTANSYKKNYIAPSYEGTSNNNSELQGLPIKEVIVTDVDGNIINQYIIPWFDVTQTYDGNMYFQMKGGWGKTPQKYLDGGMILSGDKLYSETNTYINVVNTISELFTISLQQIENESVYYVMDISDFDIISGETNYGPSNYFILKDIDNANIVGENGWKCVPLEEIKNNTSSDASQIIYLENIVDTTIGNNPHCGYGKYDDGEEYLGYFKELFKYSLETNNFDDLSYDQIEEIKKLGFTITKEVDNKKIWYFTNSNTPKYMMESIDGITYLNNAISGVPNYFTNPEGGMTNDEASANSIINVKNMEINIYNGYLKNNKYLYEVILYYLTQLIPITTIWTLNFK